MKLVSLIDALANGLKLVNKPGVFLSLEEKQLHPDFRFIYRDNNMQKKGF